METRRWRGQSIRKSRVEMVPLIDVMFLLLCFFVYAMMNMVVQKGIQVDLAQTASPDRFESSPHSYTVSVDKKGSYYLNKRVMTPEGLSAALEKIRAQGVRQTVVVNADRAATHGSVMDLLDRVQKSGVQTAIFTVEGQEI